jgi:hypothetical protein
MDRPILNRFADWLGGIDRDLLTGLIIGSTALLALLLSAALPAGGVWVVITVSAGWLLIALALHILLAGARRLVSPPREGDRKAGGGATVIVALLVALFASEGMRNYLAGVTRALFHTSFVRAPQLEVVGQPGGKADGISQLFANMNEQHGQPPTAEALLIFILVLMAGLVLARVLHDAKIGLRDTYGRPMTSVMTYPAWIAFCIYAAILVPAAYFSTGALLYLDLGQTRSISDFQRRLDEAETQAMAVFPGVEVELKDLINRAPTPDPLAASADRIRQLAAWGSRLTPDLQAWKAGYEEAALTYASAYRPLSPPDRFDDYAVQVAADYRSSIIARRVAAQQCLVALQSLKTLIGQQAITDPVAQPTLAAATKACPDPDKQSKAAPPRPPLCSDAGCGLSDNAAQARSGGAKPVHILIWGWLADAPPATVLIVGLIGFGLFGAAIRMLGRPDEVTVTPEEIEAARLTAEKAVSDAMAANAEADESQRAAETAVAQERQAHLRVEEYVRDQTALAALTAEGKTDDDPEVAALRVRLEGRNRAELDAALQKAAQDVITAKAAAVEPVVRAKRLAEEAEQLRRLYHARLRALTNQRSNVVVARPRPDGQPGAEPEYMISGAPARVLVHGLGAAFTVFLGGQSTLKLLADEGQVSPKALLLACFIGAVFAEEIWAKAKETLDRKPAAPPANGGATGSPR